MSTGYTRNDTPNNIADGNIINASDLDGEFDAIQTAFDATNGHTHDGTVGEGAPIEVIGPTQDVVVTASALRPKTDNTVDLGTPSLEFKDLYLDGTANIDSLVADTADINGGTIDGATIATSDITVGAGKTLDVSAGTFTLAADQISGDSIQGGTIGSITITTLASTTGNITNVNATTVDTTNIEVTNIKAKDGTAAATIADSTGVVTVASAVLTTADINGGSVDGAIIGGASPAAITGTTVTATGNIVVSGTVDGRDVAADGTKLDTIETNADVTDTANVTAAGALMDSELTNITAVKALNQGVATTDSPTFAGLTATTADINGGTIDGVTIGGASAGAITGTTITGTSFVTTGDMTFGDNDKAIFGAGSDLQIYHDGSNSYISDTGTGNFFIRGADYLVLEDSGGNNYFEGVSGGTARVYYAGNTKLQTTATGIYVTGTVTADGLTVGSATSQNGVFDTVFGSGGANEGIVIVPSSTGKGWVGFNNGNNANIPAQLTYNFSSSLMELYSSGSLNIQTGAASRLNISSGGDISFYEDTGTTPKMVWKSSDERLGIGTSSPGNLLEVAGATPIVEINATSGSPELQFSDGGVDEFSIQYDTGTKGLKFIEGGVGTHVTIKDGGSVGIGTTSPRAILDLEGNAALDTDTATLTTTSQTSIATFAVATFDAAKVVITANNGTDTYITELLVAHDGTTAVATEYGQLSTDTFTVAYDVDISGGNVRILATPPAVTSTTFKVIKTLM